MSAELRGRMETAAEPAAAFERFIEDMVAGLERLDLTLEPGPGGRITAGSDEVARVVAWQPGARATLRWNGTGEGDVATEIDLRFRGIESGTEVTFEARDCEAGMGSHADASGWFARQVAAPLIGALTPAAVGDWITDRFARRPTGRASRTNYRDPLYHYPSFRVILDELALSPDDVLLDVGCGGGAMLREVLKSGCRAAGIDHSIEMVRVSRDSNAAALADGRLHVAQANAERMPFAAGTFTCAAMSGVLGFLHDPVTCFAEIRRVLKPGGRFITLGSDARLRGTPAAPEPIASRLHFYDDEDLVRMGREAGFDESVVIRHDLTVHARAVGIPEEHLPLFAGRTSFLVART